MPELILYAYCGMKVPILTGDMTACHEKAKKLCRRHEKTGGTVSELDPNKWELETPDYASLVSDDEGILVIRGEDREEED